MEQILVNFINNSATIQKGVFLLAAGVLFVFAVQFIFYLTIKLWMRQKKPENEI